MQAAGELAQLLHREVELGPGGPEQRAGGVRVGGQVALDHAELDRERDEPLLRAVMEVALQAPALVHPRLEDPPARGAELLAPLRALEPEGDELGEVAEPALGVGAEGVGRVGGDEDEPPGPPARDDRRRDRRPVAVVAHHLRGAAAHVGVVVDPRGASGAVDDRRQPVALGERHGRPDGEAARVAVVPAADGDRRVVVVADRRRRRGVQQAARLLGDRAEDLGASAPEATSVATRRSAACSSASSDSAPSPVPGAPGAMVLAWSIVADASARRDPIPRASPTGSDLVRRPRPASVVSWRATSPRGGARRGGDARGRARATGSSGSAPRAAPR